MSTVEVASHGDVEEEELAPHAEGHICAPQPSTLGRSGAFGADAIDAQELRFRGDSVDFGVLPSERAVRVLPPPAAAVASVSTHFDHDDDWSGRVAAERPEDAIQDRVPTYDRQVRVIPHRDFVDSSGLPAARRQLSTAMQALKNVDQQLRRVGEGDQQLRRAAQAAATDAADARAETEGLRREVQKLKGVPRELTLLSNDQLHALQQDLSESMRNVNAELESRSKCCICRFQEREVVLEPCMHLVLCRACALRVAVCPVCRREIQSAASVRVA